jgi:hypothetical protein
LAGGTTVTITGTNFVTGATVLFGTTAASSPTVNSATKITVHAPAHAAGAVDVRVTTPGGTSAPVLADHYRYLGRPTISSVSPKTGPRTGGTTVTITGTNFVIGATVKFGTIAAASVTVNSTTKITAKSPVHAAGAADISVTTPGGTSATSAADKFTFT